MATQQLHSAYGAHPAPVPMFDRHAYTVADTCRTLSIGRTSLYELIATGEIKPVRIAGRTLIPRTEIERLTRVDRAA